LLDRFDLTSAAGKPAATYSGGMRRRLDLAMTLVGSPRLIFLDEPTTGLDPRSRRTMWQIIPRPCRRRSHDLPHHAVPWTRLTSSLAGSPYSTAGGLSPRATPGELKRRIPGGHISLQFASQHELDSAARIIDGAATRRRGH